MSNAHEPPAEDSHFAGWAEPGTETVTDAVTEGMTDAVTDGAAEPAMATAGGGYGNADPMAPPAARSSGAQGRTVALVASVAAVAGLAGGLAFRASHGSTGSNTSTQVGSTGGPDRRSTVIASGDAGDADDDGGGVFTGRAPSGRGGAGAVPSPVRGGGQSATSSGGS